MPLAEVARLDQRPIRVVHLAVGPMSGGAARGAVLLHEALLDAGCESTLVTDVVGGAPAPGVEQLPHWLHPRIDQAARRVFEQLPTRVYPRRSPALFSTGLFGRSIHRIPQVRHADIVNLHWVCGALISMRSLRRLAMPCVWTLRDLWPATGGCHYPGIHRCRRFEVGCGQCPHLGGSGSWDLSRLVFAHKARSLPRDLTIVGISSWVADEARRSALFRDRPVCTISNCVDTEVFKPFDRTAARQLLGLPLDRRIVLVGALSPDSPYKGWHLLLDALSRVTEPYGTVLFGQVAADEAARVPFLTRDVGFVRDDLRLRALYAAADVFVSPATDEAFGKTIAEALACGTPAVVFDATGPRDIVEHLECGFRARPFEPASLADGIRWVLDHPQPDRLRVAARQRAERSFSKSRVAGEYVALYRRVLSARSAPGTHVAAPAQRLIDGQAP